MLSATDPRQRIARSPNLLGIPSLLNFAVIGAVILFGVLADQQIMRRGGFGQFFKRTKPAAEPVAEKQG